VRDQIQRGLTADPRLAETGIAVIGVRVVAIRPEPEMEKALRTPARELAQQEADKATYERRALAVERERAIAENEMQSQIELARREEQLVAQRSANARRQAEGAAAAGQIETEAQAQRELRLAQAGAEGTRALGAAEAETEAAKLAPYAGLPQATLLALAVRELAGQLPQIGSLVLSPDLLAPVLAGLTRGQPVPAAGDGAAGGGATGDGAAARS
jgi:hypothetical protein